MVDRLVFYGEFCGHCSYNNDVGCHTRERNQTSRYNNETSELEDLKVSLCLFDFQFFCVI